MREKEGEEINSGVLAHLSKLPCSTSNQTKAKPGAQSREIPIVQAKQKIYYFQLP